MNIIKKNVLFLPFLLLCPQAYGMQSGLGLGGQKTVALERKETKAQAAEQKSTLAALASAMALENEIETIAKSRTELMKASIAGNTEAVTKLLAAGSQTIDAQDAQGRTALMLAIEHDKTAVAKALIAAGAELNRADKNGITPLLVAAQRNNLEIAELLLAKKDWFVTNHSDKNSYTAMMHAAARGHTGMVRLLIPQQVDLDHEFIDLLHNALPIKVAEGMLNAGATLSEKTSTAVFYCSGGLYAQQVPDEKLHRLQLASLITLAGNFIKKDFKDKSISWTGGPVKEGFFAELEKTILADGTYTIISKVYQRGDGKIDLDKPERTETITGSLSGLRTKNELLQAVRAGDGEAVNKLIATGHDVNARDTQGNTALIIAITNRYNNIAQILIKAKADVNCADKDGITPLIEAIKKDVYGEHNNSELVKLLLEHGADVLQRDPQGWDALMHAARGRKDHIVKLLAPTQAHIDALVKHILLGAEPIDILENLLEFGYTITAQTLGYDKNYREGIFADQTNTEVYRLKLAKLLDVLQIYLMTPVPKGFMAYGARDVRSENRTTGYSIDGKATAQGTYVITLKTYSDYMKCMLREGEPLTVETYEGILPTRQQLFDARTDMNEESKTESKRSSAKPAGGAASMDLDED